MWKFILIHAGPTPWDEEDRITGRHPLPLTDEARAAITSLANALTDQVTAVYRAKSNEACDEAARIIAKRFALRPRDNRELDGWNLGLWQGLRREDARRRFPKVVRQWEESPGNIVPPEGESLADALARLRGALRSIILKNRQGVVALALRPHAMQMAAGLLR